VQAVGNTRERAQFIDKGSRLSIRCQCRLLKVPRSLVYYERTGESEENLTIMEAIDRLHMEDPSAGTRRMVDYIKRKTVKSVARNRIRRLMRKMGIEAIYPHKRTTIPGGPSGIFPYLLKDIEITRPNQVWSADITYIPMRRGFMYLFGVIDWYSRKVIAWELSNTLDVGFCLKCLRRAMMTYGMPEIINTDQGSHFTCEQWRECVQTAGIQISMDGRGRWLDNVAIERFWRTIKYEDIYLKSYPSPLDLERGIGKFILRYNTVRPHRSLSGATPEEVFCQSMALAV